MCAEIDSRIDEKFFLTEKNISWNQRFSNSFSKAVTFTKVLSKKSVRENFCNFHPVVWDLVQKSFDFPKKVRFQNEREEED